VIWNPIALRNVGSSCSIALNILSNRRFRSQGPSGVGAESRDIERRLESQTGRTGERPEQDTSKFLAFQLQLPANDSRDNSRKCRQRSNKQVVANRARERAALGPKRDEIKNHGRYEQRDREMSQDDVFGQYHRFEIKGVWAHPR
jgi:hypothetical protein